MFSLFLLFRFFVRVLYGFFSIVNAQIKISQQRFEIKTFGWESTEHRILLLSTKDISHSVALKYFVLTIEKIEKREICRF